ncbi:MAG: hypothetical protein ACRDTC_16585 [Pseudonocardiaceae bacterium]
MLPPAAPRRGPAAILALQRSVGNRAVATSLGPHLNRPVVQRARLNVRPNGTISGVSQFPGRPPSNLSRQGQHLTAYVVFVDTILSHVRDRTPAQAADQLIWLAGQFKELPFMADVNQWNRHIHESLDYIIVQLQTALAINPRNELNIRVVVGNQIDDLLAQRNRVPHTAISESGTFGHGEAGNAGSLETMETALRTARADSYGAAEATQAVQQMWELFDYDPPEPAAESNQLVMIEKRVLTHLKSMGLAYPHLFKWLTEQGSGYWLMRYLRSHRVDVKCLNRLSDERLEDIENYAHERL